MKTFVIAQHHGVFLTLESMLDSGIEDICVIIPNSQVQKYNQMYSENPTKPDFQVFKNYDKLIGSYIKSKNADIKAYVYDDFDIKNTITSTLSFINASDVQEIVACVMSGCLVIKNYGNEPKLSLSFKELGACYVRVYAGHNQLQMYHMIDLPKYDPTIDCNFFVVDMTKIAPYHLEMSDVALMNNITKRKQLCILPREYNGKDDVLIGEAISARQTLMHQLNIKSGYVVNLWNRAIRNPDSHKSDEIFGYPFDIYKKYAERVSSYLPRTTIQKMIDSGKETERWTAEFQDLIEIIDL